MARRRSSGVKRFFIFLIGIIIVGGGAFLGFQFFTKTGLFRVPGVVTYDESLNESELSTLKGIFTEEVDLDKNVTISAKETTKLEDLADGEYLVEVNVPVTDFYDARGDIDEFSEEEFEYIPLSELTNQKKLLSVGGEYYLDNLNSGAKFRILKFDSEKFEEEIKPLVEESFAREFPTKDTVLSFAQTGVTALSRGMNEKLKNVGEDAKYFAENIGEFLSGFDLTHTSNESSFTEAATKENICSDPKFIDTLKAIGLDIVELTGNHNEDCGDEAAEETVDIYTQNGIKMVGGGKTAEEAAMPLEINEKGNNITFLAYNLSTGGATLDDTPGANQYYEENAREEIAAAKERGDFVLVDVQYYECAAYASEYEDTTCDYANSAAGDQVGFFRSLIDMGADVVVGTSAHQPQTFETYGDGVIYYGLGNLFFDQVWWPGTTRSLVLAHYFYDGKLLQTRIIPTIYDNKMQTAVMETEAAEAFIERLANVHP